MERRILVPLGETSHPSVEKVAFAQARRLSQAILEEEDCQSRKVMVTAISLQRLPGVNPFYYLQKGGNFLGGYLVEVSGIEFCRGSNLYAEKD